MRILIPLKQNNNIDDNPFVRVLSHGLESFGHVVVCDKNELRNNFVNYDLIFFQWPDLLLQDEKKNENIIGEYESLLKSIKAHGVKTIITVHNLHPHNNDSVLTDLYNLIFSYVDGFHHMGDYSYEMLLNKYPNATHFIVPHPLFYDEADVPLNHMDYKKKYGIPLKKPTVMAFGGFRNDEEREMFLYLSRKYYFRCCFWAPKFNRVEGVNRNVLQKLLSRLKYGIQGIKMFRGPVSDVEAAEMARASDIFFIQRNEILNSGNLPLGFFGKCIVVGPDVGNVGNILKTTGNPVFIPNDFHSLHEAMEQALNLFCQNSKFGQHNYDYAKTNWNKMVVSKELNESLKLLFK